MITIKVLKFAKSNVKVSEFRVWNPLTDKFCNYSVVQQYT